MRKTPGTPGASLAPAYQPAIILNRPQQGADQSIDASPVRIARMLRKIYPHEREVKAFEVMGVTPGRRRTLVDGELKWVELSELAQDGLAEAKRKRDDHVAALRTTIDYALTTLAYDDAPCPTCRLPLDPLEFVEAVPDFEPPAAVCATCLGRGAVRVKRTDAKTVANIKLIGYWDSVVDDYLRCSKIKAATSEADRCYQELELANRSLLIKFGNEKQTSLEGADAEQGVRQGLIDAAIRFNPLKRKNGRYCCAAFGTVAYNWARRNSRARQKGQKRAGIDAKNLGAMGDDDGGVTAMIKSYSGALGVFGGKGARHNGKETAANDRPTSVSPSLVLDLREKVEQLPDLQRGVISFELAGYTNKEIASQMDITLAKVRKLRQTAYETLRGSLEGYVTSLHD